MNLRPITPPSQHCRSLCVRPFGRTHSGIATIRHDRRVPGAYIRSFEGSDPVGLAGLSGRPGAVLRGALGDYALPSPHPNHDTVEGSASVRYHTQPDRVSPVGRWSCSKQGSTGAVIDSGYRNRGLNSPRPFCTKSVPFATACRLTPVSLTREHHRGPSGKWLKWNQGSGLISAKFRALFYSRTTRCPVRRTAADAPRRGGPRPTGGEIRGGAMP